jgi:hypothetical protein
MPLRDQVQFVSEIALLSMIEAATRLDRSGSFEMIGMTYSPLLFLPGVSTGQREWNGFSLK